MITINIGFTNNNPNFLIDSFKKMTITRLDLDWTAKKTLKMIRDRTMKGLDYTGAKFYKYSGSDNVPLTKYALKRQKVGKTVDIVNLQWSGNMLNSMTVKSTDKEAQIYFADATSRFLAYKHNAGKDGVPQREFFGLTQQECEFVFNAMLNRKARGGRL